MGSHLFRLSQLQPQLQREGGSRLAATKSNFPQLQGQSLYKLVLEPHALREPHWHANADELGYCLQGSALVSMYASGDQKEAFLVSAGDAFFIPSGALHSLETVGEEKAVFILQFSHEQPEDFGLSAAFGMFSDAVLGNTWEQPAELFHTIERSTQELFITKTQQSSPLSREVHYSSAYRFALEASAPLLSNPFGRAKVARQNVWPVLTRQALYSLTLWGAGMREPHWHPNTAEMGYVADGKGRMSLLSPDGQVETYEMEQGDLYFIPKAYPHHIECLTESLHILIFFDQPMPFDIGFTASVKSFSDESLAAIFHTSKDFFNKLPTYYQDLFFVKKANPLDPPDGTLHR